MFKRVVALSDAMCRRIWPSTQKEMDNQIYSDLIEQLYACKSSIVLGTLSNILTAVVIGLVDHIPMLIGYALLVHLPVATMRMLHVASHQRLSLDLRTQNSSLQESRFGVQTIIGLVSMSIITTIIMIWGSPESKFAITAVIITNDMGMSARNAGMPTFARVQSLILLIPVSVGLAFSAGWLAKLLSLLTILIFRIMANTTKRIRADTISAREEAFKAEHMAKFDGLTNLPNRRYFNDLLETYYKKEIEVSVLYLDLDEFKNINDSQGHPTGDELLIRVAERLAKLVAPETTLISRFGGDEFVILTTDDALLLANRILRAFDTPFQMNSGPIRIKCSMGINNSLMSSNVTDLIKNADIALYAAKAKGQHGFAVFDKDMEREMQKKTLLESRLRLAIEKNEITLHYQPIVSMKDGAVVGAEALARWTDDQLGQVRPDIFIKAAEDMGLIEPLGEHLLRMACRDAAKWTLPIRVSVNVSPIQFKNPDRLLEALRGALEMTGLKGNRLCIEITEGTMIDDLAGARKTMFAIKDMDINLALDDFGSGYCSLSYLDQIPFDKIKIDRNLMLAAMKSKTQEIVIEMVAKMSAEMKVDTVIEGIEDSEQVFKMLMLGGSQAQGYLFGRPSADQNAFMLTSLPTPIEAMSA